MDFNLTNDQIRRREQAAEFARTELNTDVITRDHAGEFSRDLWKKCADFGFLGLCVPNQYGGSALSLLDTILTLEGLGYGSRDHGIAYGVNAQIWSVVECLVRFGTEQQKQRYLPGICGGELIGCYAMTEPDSGSDCFSLHASADKSKDGYVLNGTKQLVTFAPIADFALIFAKTDLTAGRWGVSTFIVDREIDGYLAAPVQHKMGLRTIPIGEIVLQDCSIPEQQRLGPEGSGASVFNTSQETERSCILASQLGAMQYQLEQTIEFARKRKQFGKSIGKFQSVSNRIVDMKLRLETSRLLLYKTAWLREQGDPNMLEAALTNLYLAECYVQSSLDAIRVRGGRGYLTENEIERDMRDSIAAPLYGGTSDIQRDIVARLLGL